MISTLPENRIKADKALCFIEGLVVHSSIKKPIKINDNIKLFSNKEDQHVAHLWNLIEEDRGYHVHGSVILINL